MKDLNLSHYLPAIAELVGEMPLAPLGPGEPFQGMRGKLETIGSEFSSAVDRTNAKACQAGLWLAYNFLDESHAISQEIHSVEGSYWHAIMHRREPDYSNSKYWFRQVGYHPIFESLRLCARDLAQQTVGRSGAAEYLTRQSRWDAPAFVDLCEASEASDDEGSADFGLCCQIQRAEWMLLFAYCFDKALGVNGVGTD